MVAFNATSPSSVVPQHVKRALTYMRANLHEKIALSDVVAACGASERTLLKQFKRFLGVPPLAHLHQLRLAAARAELLKPECTASIGEVAASCGITHPGRFSTDYRHFFGEMPSETRARATPRTALRRAPVVSDRDVPSLSIHVLRTETLEERREAQDIVDQLIASLSRMRVATVTRERQPRTPGHRAAARYSLEGRLALRGERARVILWLVDEDGRHVWGDSYDGSLRNEFALQDRVIEGVLGGVVPGITRAEINRSLDKVPENLAARDLMLRSLPTALRVDAASANSAFASATEAMQIDPGNALPVAMAAYSQARLWVCDGVVPEQREEASRLAQRAGILDSGDPLVMTARAAVAALLFQRDDAEALATRAIAMDPTCAWAWERRGFARLLVGDDPDAALNDFQRSLHFLGPYMPRDNYFIGIAHAHRAASRLDEAIQWLRKGLAENPDAMILQRLVACWAWRLGDKSTSRQSVEVLRRKQPDLTVTSLIPLLPHSDCPDVLKDAGLPL